MENWSIEILTMLESMVKDVEQFLTDTVKDINEAVEGFVEASEEIVEQMQVAFEAEIEPHINGLLDPILEAYLGFEIAVEETTQPVIHSVEPFLNDHPACVGVATIMVKLTVAICWSVECIPTDGKRKSAQTGNQPGPNRIHMSLK